jgi:hypothetical protein
VIARPLRFLICRLPEFYNRMLIINADLFEVPEYVLT